MSVFEPCYKRFDCWRPYSHQGHQSVAMPHNIIVFQGNSERFYGEWTTYTSQGLGNAITSLPLVFQKRCTELAYRRLPNLDQGLLSLNTDLFLSIIQGGNKRQDSPKIAPFSQRVCGQ